MLQSYRGRLPPKRASDAELIDDDAYSSDQDQPVEAAPSGLVDRLYQEDYNAEPEGDPRRQRISMGIPNGVPTTKRTY